MEYWFAMGFAILGGVLIGIVCTTLYFTIYGAADFDDDRWDDDEY